MCQPPISTLFPYTTLFRSFAISGAEVFVGTAEVGVNAAAVSVNCDMTVLAADVRTTATSGVGSTDAGGDPQAAIRRAHKRSEEHTSELQSRLHLVCRLLLENVPTTDIYTFSLHDALPIFCNLWRRGVCGYS